MQIADWRAWLLLALLAGGCAAGKAFRQGEAGDARRQPRRGGRRVPQGRAGGARQRDLQDRAAARDAGGVARAPRQGARVRGAGSARGGARRVPAASEYDPSNRTASAKVAELDRIIRDRIEASRPKPAIQAMRERARAASAEPILNPGVARAAEPPLQQRQPARHPERDRRRARHQHQLRPRVRRPRRHRPPRRRHARAGAQPDHDDEPAVVQGAERAVDLRLPGHAAQARAVRRAGDPHVLPLARRRDRGVSRSSARSSGCRASRCSRRSPATRPRTRSPCAARRRWSASSRRSSSRTTSRAPRSSSTSRSSRSIARGPRRYGLNLSEYALGGVFSPEVVAERHDDRLDRRHRRDRRHRDDQHQHRHVDRRRAGCESPPPFNLNTISRGVSTADFYLAVPTAIVRFLESDTNTKIIAKPQLRGAEGTKLTLNLGEQIPVISTSYTPIATGGAGVNPLSSYQYQDVGVNIDMTPTVTLDGDIRLDLTLDNSQLGAGHQRRRRDRAVVRPAQGHHAPAAARRRIEPARRACCRRPTRRASRDFPGASTCRFSADLFASNTVTSDQTEIVMLLTPHIVRTHEITEADLRPIYIGSQQNLGVGGPPPLIAPQQPDAAPPPRRRRRSPAPAPPAGSIPTGIRRSADPAARPWSAPPGSSPVPGTVLLPPADAAGAATARAAAGGRRHAAAAAVTAAARRRRRRRRAAARGGRRRPPPCRRRRPGSARRRC